MPHVTMAKADADDIKQLRTFMLLFERVCQSTDFDIDDIEEMDKNCDTRQQLEKFIIKTGDVWANGSPGDFDYESFFKHWVDIVGPCWRRVVFGCEALINAFCDPTVDHLAPLPCLDLMHVSPEQ